MSYGQSLDANPFADTSSSPNPFSHANDSAFSLETRGAAPSGGIDNIGAYVADHDQRARELERKQQELERREQELSRREAEVAQYKPNWPPFIPFLVHDLTLVPTEHQRNARLLYWYWLELEVTLLFNFVGCLCLVIGGFAGGVSSLSASIGYLVFITLLSFVLWYYPVYTAWRRINKRGAAILFYMYFIFGGCHILFALYMTIGAPYTGSSGLFNTIRMLIDKHWIAGIFGIIACVGWAFQLVGGLVLYKLVWNFKNHNAEISWGNAKSEFAGLSMLFKLFRS